MTNWHPFLAVLITPAIAASVVGGLAQASAASTINVSCQTTAAVPEIVASPTEQDNHQQVTLLTFLPEYFSEQTALQQCQSTAIALQKLNTDGALEYLASDTLNGLPTVCSVERRGMTCDSFGAQVLFTLSQNVDPSQALYDMLGSNFKEGERPVPRTVSRIYTRINTGWWPF